MRIILYGAGGHARVVADIVGAAGIHTLLGFVDDNRRPAPARETHPVLGGSAQLPSLLADGVEGALVCIGGNRVRAEKAQLLLDLGFELVDAVHPSAVLAPDVVVGRGTVVAAGVVVNASARIGCNVIVNTAASVDHDCVLGGGCHLSPGVRLAGNVTVGREAHVGIGAVVIPGVTIGDGAVIGAGAVVLCDVPAGETWVGNPAHRVDGPRR